MARLSYKETKEREEKVQRWLDEGLSMTQIARLLDVRVEAVRRFLKLRGWETHHMKELRIKAAQEELEEELRELGGGDDG